MLNRRAIGVRHAIVEGVGLIRRPCEPLRPAIDARVFAYIASREFRRADFVPYGASVCRLDRAIASNLLTSACLPQRDIDGAAGLVSRSDRILPASRRRRATSATGDAKPAVADK
jgi:hypothetical protein